MRAMFFIGVVLFLFLVLAFGVQFVTAQTPTPAPTITPTPSPTPSFLPDEARRAVDWFTNLVTHYGWLVALVLGAVGVLLAVGIWLFTHTASGVGQTVQSHAKKQADATVARMQYDEHLREYLENFRRTYAFLDLKSLDERGGYDTDVRLREVYIRLRARGSLAEDERRTKNAPGEMMGERQGHAPELTEWLARFPRLVVLGRAGSGKSTFLKYVALVLADARLGRNPALAHTALGVAFEPLPVPIYFPLREFGAFWKSALKDEDKFLELRGRALLRFLEHNFSRYGLDAAYFQKLLRAGQCLIFLDGLDEVKSDLRSAVVEVVEAFVREFASTDGAHPNRYVVACRPEAYRGQSALHQFQEVTLESLDQDQVADFVQRWYREVLRRHNALTPDAENEAKQKSDTLLRAINEKDQVRDLTDTPLLLTLVAMLHHRQELPDSRVELYHDCTRLLLDKWEKSRPGEQGRLAHQELTPPEVPVELERRREFLQPAAFWLLQTGLPAAPKSEWAREIVTRLQLPGDPVQARQRVEIFLEWAAERCNILEETDEGIFQFTHHRTFQEYLAAGYLVSREEDGLTIALGLATNRDWWETLRLMVAATRNTKRRSDFLCRALERAEPEGALLVGFCLAELKDLYLDAAILDAARQKLLALMTDPELPAKETRALAGELLGRIGDPRADVTTPLPVLVPVPGGTYWIGDDKKYERERPRHQVTLTPFWIGKYPVTNAQFEHFIDAK